ncbi:HD domain-containing protein [Desulfomicrobium baculatum]|uniref:5'-deoxynucleotidase n=1 Tax=Desulfomicrobium baculatum (strain DSM 4028 / VKM B-1378 / X) TaxID=525897 RepID=C7LXM8_DESBD|nr:HD domain-containing protein [Desulfomicrobium baculatum]ACU91264.1 metal dependent phosphohydrolase [Desulfomicrobium baculatum DSM 4028]
MLNIEPEAKPVVEQTWKRLADFVFELGMLRKTPRTGYQFLGSGAENVAEHSFRTAMIGYMLARKSGADVARTVFLCLFHDVHEARIGDFNYVNRIYNTSNPVLAITHALEGTGLRQDALELWHELEAGVTLESRLAQDADQLDFIANLKEELDLGNPYASKWLDHAVLRLKTDPALELARAIQTTDQSDWWFVRPDESWWRKGNGKPRP